MLSSPGGDATAANPPRSRPAVPRSLARPLAVLVVVVVTVAVVLGVLTSGDAAPSGPDLWAATVVSGWWPEPGAVAYAIDVLGVPWVVAVMAAAAALIAAGFRHRRLAVAALLAPAVTGLVTSIAKPISGRTIHGPNLSYPSGHVAAVTAIAAVLALLVVDLVGRGPVLGTVVFLAGTLVCGCVMAVDQIAISAHYPTDTVGGLATAVAVVVVVAAGIDRAADRFPTLRRPLNR